MIRTFHVQNTYSLAQLQKQGNSLDLMERLVHPRSPLRSALLAALLPATTRISTYMLDTPDETGPQRGLVQARCRPGRPEQEIVFMGPSLEHGNGSHAVWQRLLAHVCVKAGEAGQHRIYARMTRGSDEAQVFKNVGFTSYAEEAIHCLLPDDFPDNPHDSLGLRKQTTADSWSLQRLYAVVTPHMVQIAEGLAQGQWQLNGRPIEGRGRRYGYVWDGEGEILAALHIRSGNAGYGLRLLIHPDVHDRVDALIQAGLSLIKAQRETVLKPIYLNHRTYQGGLTPVLETHKFQQIATQVVMVKHITVRARDVLSRLVPFEAPVEANVAVPSPFLKTQVTSLKGSNGHTSAKKSFSS